MTSSISPVEYSQVDAAPSGEPLFPVDLELVGNLEVQLNCHIGQCSMDVATLFALRKGDVVDLGTSVDEPVTLTLHGKVVARGRVVAQDGQFAIEIVDVAKSAGAL
jgi:flagellar motor switch protein FliN/FliY